MFKKKSNLLQNNKRKLIAYTNSKSPISEQYRTIRTNIQFAAVDKEMQIIMVTSSVPGEGKSTTAANLAVVMAQQAKKVLFIDADLRKPTVHYTFNQTNTFGLTNVLMKKIELADAVKTTDVDNLYVLTSGPVPPNPAELLGSKMMKDLLNQIRMEFDTVIIDTPPLLAVTDAQIVANICDGTVLVISSGKAEIENAKKAKDMLQATSSTLLGAVINNKKVTGDSSYYYYYGN
ncbi:CpsD/CapB family tyrosine-protein kinase [Bacillus sp. AGMB 02131]|uniref:non-specific protein-tyrosine kinase n=1 Tax=Peribacillus faecalis TaxID=2772559 RepID=A0A927CTY5_9BACI|nr:CpsD/CapB family tyrosine-protein kinase [Peribacillus faecalis]MBD3107149.1 CpsD/CapB family tyrosine-protein kinase [Peribacillus faecalis]